MNRRNVVLSAMAAGAAASTAGPLAAAPPRRPITVRSRDGIQLFHRDWGEGPTIVFVASWALASPMWAYQVAHFSDAGFRCVALDRRGHGRSDAAGFGYDMDTLADDVGQLIEQLDLRDVVLVGHSMGGAEAIHYLARHGSGRIRKLALLAPVAPYIVQTPDNPHGAPRSYYEATMRDWARDFPAWVEANKAPFFTPSTSPGMADWLADQLLQTPVPVAIAAFRAVIGKDLRPDLPKIDVPTLILHGDKDASAPLEITGRQVAAGVKEARLKVYPGAPHGLFVTHVDQVNRDLESFIRG